VLSLKGKLILEDGSVFYGDLLNNMKATGEVVFNTSMVGYQESLTDPSYCRQILTLTYPLVGNYGIADIFMQSRKSFVNGFVIGELCEHGSNWHYESSLAEFLTKQGVPCLYNVDTRAVTRRIRNQGTMKGIIVPEDAAKTEMEELFAVPIKKDVVMEVTTPEPYTIEADASAKNPPFVVAIDYGVKRNILKSLHEKGCKLTVVPASTKAEDVLATPAGRHLPLQWTGRSRGCAGNGRGDQEAHRQEADFRHLPRPSAHCTRSGCQNLQAEVRPSRHESAGQGPADQPRARSPPRIMASQSMQILWTICRFKVTHINVNDGTVEGMRHESLPLFSVQYHPEAAPGPDDNMYLFDEFWSMLKKGE
jgi:carbamoyl-phosphate synthase small subunit